MSNLHSQEDLEKKEKNLKRAHMKTYKHFRVGVAFKMFRRLIKLTILSKSILMWKCYAMQQGMGILKWYLDFEICLKFSKDKRSIDYII